MRKLILITMLLAAGLTLCKSPALAQEHSDKWSFRATPYFVAAAMNGDLTVNGRTAAVDMGFDKILKNLDFGAMLNFVAAKGPWSINFDAIYMGLGAAGEIAPEETRTAVDADVGMDQWMVELAGGYEIAPWLDALIGARYNMLSGELELQGRQEREQSRDVSWVDPVAGARLTTKFAEDWTLRGRADIGGFGITSNLTWQLAAYVEFRASDLIAITGGYRYLSNDYQSGSDDELFHYDMVVSGPAFGVSFVF